MISFGEVIHIHFIAAFEDKQKYKPYLSLDAYKSFGICENIEMKSISHDTR